MIHYEEIAALKIRMASQPYKDAASNPYGFHNDVVRVEHAGSVYPNPAVLLRCYRCGALVLEFDAGVHDNWHDGAESDDE